MNILITSVGRRTYIVEYFKSAINNCGLVHAANSEKNTPSFLSADKFVVTPLIYDDDYIPFLLNYCKKYDINIIISLFDIDLYVLSLNKDKFSEIGVKVIVSDSDFIKVCNDKWMTYKYLTKNGFLTPRTYIDLNEVIKDIDSKKIKFPLMVKPRWGMGSLSIYTADNKEELNVFYKKVKIEIQKSYIKYESSSDMTKAVVIQEMLNGQEYGLDIINDLEGNYVNTIVRKKIAMRSGETDCAEVIKNKKIKLIGKKLGNITKHIANLDVDIFEVGNDIYILEMNARFGGGYPFSHLAGVNLPVAIVDWCNNKKVSNDVLEIDKEILGCKDIGIVQLLSKNN